MDSRSLAKIRAYRPCLKNCRYDLDSGTLPNHIDSRINSSYLHFQDLREGSFKLKLSPRDAFALFKGYDVLMGMGGGCLMVRAWVEAI